MWKESYRIGVDSIDKQHMELFRMVDGLVRAIADGADKVQFERAIRFLKNYVVLHFKEEEQYQEKIRYPLIEEHKKKHRDFTQAVLIYEKKLIETDYDIKVVKHLAGTLTSWLIYHVADADQRLVKGETKAADSGDKSVISSVLVSTIGVVEKMTGVNRAVMKANTAGESSIGAEVFIEIGLVGDKKGSIVYGFSKEFACNLVKSMTMMEVGAIDELVCSALAEMSNISSGNATIQLSGKDIMCDITPPSVSYERKEEAESLNGITVDTGLGMLEINVYLE